MVIDFAQAHDIAGWMELVNLVQDYFPGLNMEEYQTALAACMDAQEALAVKNDGVIVGALTFSHANGELSFLAVHPHYRKKGIAKELILKLITLFPAGTRLSVTTYRDGDSYGVAARKLYQSLGFSFGKLVTVFDYPCQEMFYIVK